MAAATPSSWPLPEASGSACGVSRCSAGPGRGDPVLLERLVPTWSRTRSGTTQPGGWVEVDTGRAGPAAVVRVTNSGPPIPADEVAALFEPFRRLEPDRTGAARGTGLGLSIVRAVATAHGGTPPPPPAPAAGWK